MREERGERERREMKRPAMRLGPVTVGSRALSHSKCFAERLIMGQAWQLPWRRRRGLCGIREN